MLSMATHPGSVPEEEQRRNGLGGFADDKARILSDCLGTDSVGEALVPGAQSAVERR